MYDYWDDLFKCFKILYVLDYGIILQVRVWSLAGPGK